MPTPDSDQKKYEIMLILTPELSESETEEKISQLKKLIEKNKGEIYHEDIWGKKDLAYPIKKQSAGFYVVFNFTFSDPQKAKELENTLRLDLQVLRFLIIKTPYNYEIKNYQTEGKEAVEEPKKTVTAEEIIEKVQKESKAEEKKETPKKEKKATAKKTGLAKKKVKKTVKKEEVEEKPAEEKKETEQLKSLEDLDAKLKQIIDDPDINL